MGAHGAVLQDAPGGTKVSDEAKADLPAPRYHSFGENGHRFLITDEQEWLARADSWGIDMLPESILGRKQMLHEYHCRQQLVPFLECEICRHPIAEFGGEEILPDDADDQSAIREWYACTHPLSEPKCDAWPIWKVVINWHRGVICLSELRNGLSNQLFEMADKSRLTPASADWRESFRAWSRTLALDLIGPNPFRPTPFSPSWRTDTAVTLARTMYESREFSAMPILADALQDAGCDNTDILNHCRDMSQVHVRGCWVVDLVLGKA